MNKEQIEIAEKKVKEIKLFSLGNKEIQDFINILDGSDYLRLTTMNQCDLGLGSKLTYDLIGAELVELLKKKLWEREDYLEKLGADDLINER